MHSFLVHSDSNSPEAKIISYPQNNQIAICPKWLNIFFFNRAIFYDYLYIDDSEIWNIRRFDFNNSRKTCEISIFLKKIFIFIDMNLILMYMMNKTIEDNGFWAGVLRALPVGCKREPPQTVTSLNEYLMI